MVQYTTLYIGLWALMQTFLGTNSSKWSEMPIVSILTYSPAAFDEHMHYLPNRKRAELGTFLGRFVILRKLLIIQSPNVHLV